MTAEPDSAAPAEIVLQLRNRLGDLAPIGVVLDRLAASGHLPVGTHHDVQLAAEEAFTNIVKYAHADGRDDHPVTLGVRVADRWLELEFADDGIAFDPLTSVRSQLDRPFAARAAGLMGIPLMRALVDECHYERRGDRNHLRLRKRLPNTS